jgi:hypothetical protein
MAIVRRTWCPEPNRYERKNGDVRFQGCHTSLINNCDDWALQSSRSRGVEEYHAGRDEPISRNPRQHLRKPASVAPGKQASVEQSRKISERRFVRLLSAAGAAVSAPSALE